MLLAFLLVAAGRPALALGRPRLVILAVDRVTLDELWTNRLPNIHRLMHEGATGLMTTRSLGGLAPEKIYLSIGAGEPVTGGVETGLAFDRGERTLWGLTGGEEYRLQSGRDTRAQIVHLGLAGVAKANPFSPGRYGRLGEALKKSGWRLAALGNADRNGTPGREAVAMLMDRQGRVALGCVGASTLVTDWRAPGSRRTDYEVLQREYDRQSSRAGVILIALGDAARVQAAGSVLTPAQASRHLRTALARIDRFLGFILTHRQRPERIIWLVASPPLAQVVVGERLTPIVLWGDGVAPGLAYSTSTRQAGIVTPYDVTATIATMCGVTPRLLTLGRPIGSRPGSPADLPRRYGELLRNYQQRAPVFDAYGYVLLLVTLSTLGLAVRGGERASAVSRLLRDLLSGLALVPIFLLVLGFFPLGPTWLTLTLVGLFAILAGLMLRRLLPAAPARLAVVGFLTAGLVAVDVLSGSLMLRRSLLGYSPVFGARFYGLGNEYLGVVLGGVILGSVGLAGVRPHRYVTVLGLVFVLTTLVIALPQWGANIGGGIAAVLGLGYTYLLLTGRRLGWREGSGLILSVMGLFVFLIACDLWGMRGQVSHLGQAVLRVRSEGLQGVVLFARSKLAMSFRLLTYTAWTWVLLGLLLLAPVALRYPPGWLRRHLAGSRSLREGLRGMLATATVGLLANDSGVVVAATICIYFGLALTYLPLGLEGGPERRCALP